MQKGLENLSRRLPPLLLRPLTGGIDIPRPLRYVSDWPNIAFKIPILRKQIGVFCGADLNDKGSVQKGNHRCFSNDFGDREYSDAADEALSVSEFLPALVDGSTTRVWFAFTVIFIYDDEGCSVSAIPNLGYQGDELGIGNYAPQEILDDFSWRAATSRQGRGIDSVTRVYHMNDGIMFFVSAEISESGVASDPKIDRNSFARKRELRAAVQGFVKSRFIPGFYQGKPKRMRYHSYLFAD